MKKRILPILLALCLVVTLIPCSIYADASPLSHEVYTDEKLSFTLERIVNEGQTIVYVKDLNGKILHTAINDGGVITLDGVELDIDVINFSPVFPEPGPSLRWSDSDVSWNSWQTSTVDLKFTTLTVAAMAGVIALAAPWIALKIATGIAGVYIAGYADGAYMEVTMRYGTRDQYLHYQRETDFYSGSTHLYGPHEDRGYRRN